MGRILMEIIIKGFLAPVHGLFRLPFWHFCVDNTRHYIWTAWQRALLKADAIIVIRSLDAQFKFVTRPTPTFHSHDMVKAQDFTS